MKKLIFVLKYAIATVIFVSCIVYFVFNYERIETYMFTLDYIAIIYIIVFAFLPIASEINLFGFSVKKEIQNVKSKLDDGILDIKNQIVDFKISNSNTIYNLSYSQLPTPKEIQELKHEIEDINLTKKQEEMTNRIFSEKEMDIPDNIVFLFKTRWVLENILKSYLRFFPEMDKLRYNLNKIVRIINTEGFIKDQTAKITLEVLNICNRGIHGEKITDEYVDFVKKAIPVIYKGINDVRERLGYYPVGLCPKCGYNGDLLEDRVCPNCGHIIKKEGN